jgi:hypothetical protein
MPLIDPIYEYDHTVGSSITGGYVYRGSALSAIYIGRYFFADAIRGRVWSIGLSLGFNNEATATGVIEHTTELGGTSNLGLISAFGVDNTGELYVVSLTLGKVLKIVSTCTYALAPSAAQFDATGGSGTIAVSAPAGCSWTPTSNDSFLLPTGPQTNFGPGTTTYLVTPNVGAPSVTTPTRVGTLSIGGVSFTVVQTGCTFVIAPTSTTLGMTPAAGRVDVTTPSVCPWSVTGLPAWAMTTSGSTGTGPGAWQYSVSVNASGAPRAQTIAVAGQPFQLRQVASPLTPLTPGDRLTITLTDQAAERWMAFETVAGRSYCAQVAPGSTEVTASTPTLSALRADGTTPLGGGAGLAARACFVATATETALLRITQSDGAPRAHRLHVVETTLWANWFFVGQSYSSFTLLRNTTTAPVNATVIWRDNLGAAIRIANVVLPEHAVWFTDARNVAGTTPYGSIDIAHDGPPNSLDASQSTISAATGLSFDTVAGQRWVR